MRVCAVVPTFENPDTVGAVISRIREVLPEIFVIDDGSGERGREACAALARSGSAVVVRHAFNRGKGAAVRTGLEAARAAGFTHAFQIDADGQHDLAAIPAFVDAARSHPESAILGHPVYESTAPRLRIVGRELTRFWVDLEVGGRGRILDAMVGFRIYPIGATLALGTRCDRMDFDVEVAILLARSGVRIVNRPVGIRYLPAHEGGISHFRMVRDNLALFRLHSRICARASIEWCLSRLRPHARVSRGEPAAADPSRRDGSPDWLRQRERGARFTIELASFVATRSGRLPARALARAIGAYYLVFDGRARQASREWLARVHERPARLAEVHAQFSAFAQVTMDRIFFARRALEGIEIRRTGNHHLESHAREKRGAILLGAHLGSFEAMRAASVSERFPVTIVGHFENAKMINEMLERLDPGQSDRVVHVGRDPVSLALTLRDRLAEGGMVALLADRVGFNDKFIAVDFFGAKARFATGPFLLAAILKCPVYLVFGIYRPPNRYELFCEPFAEKIVLPRGRREEFLRIEVARYARRLEDYARQAPDNWFNFFDFWEKQSR